MHCVRRKEGSKRVLLLSFPPPSDMAEQPPAADALQPLLRYGFRAQLRRSVRRQSEAAPLHSGSESESLRMRVACGQLAQLSVLYKPF